MNKVSLASSVGALLGGLLLASSAIAQGISNDKQGIPNENVTVVAPYITHETQTNLGVGNRGIYDVNSLTKEVSYADLDLSKSSDDDRFFQRINDTAKEACAELKAKYPDPPHAPVTDDNQCMKQATDQAMLVANALISRAQVAMVTPPAPVQEQTAEVAPPPEPAPAVEAEATTPAPTPPKQDRN
jgi:UrcA family protein